MKNVTGSNRWKLVGSLVLLLGAIAFVMAQYKSSVPQAPEPGELGPRHEQNENHSAPPQGENKDGERPEPGRMLNRQERENMRAEMTERLGLTEDQLAQIDEIDKQFEGKRGPEAWAGRAQAMQEILTSDQQQKLNGMRDEMRERFQERMKQRMMERASVLSPEEQELFMKKLEERIKNGPPHGFGGHPPGDGPPPDGEGGPPPED
ncbi:hypothetical protein KQI84_15010 [bacterium]|nr:hypothetical protein [bacterium]